MRSVQPARVPQAVKIIRDRETRAISLPGTALCVIGVLLWLVYGIAITDVPLIGSTRHVRHDRDHSRAQDPPQLRRATMPERRFPPPWSVEELDGYFVRNSTKPCKQRAFLGQGTP